MEQMHQVADKLAKSFPYSESKVPQGDTQEATFNMLQESFDSLTSTINEKRKMLQHYIMLWHNYNDLKEDVSTIIKDVEGSVDKLKESLHDPAVPPTTVVDNAKVCACCVYTCKCMNVCRCVIVCVCMCMCMCMYMYVHVCVQLYIHM